MLNVYRVSIRIRYKSFQNPNRNGEIGEGPSMHFSLVQIYTRASIARTGDQANPFCSRAPPFQFNFARLSHHLHNHAIHPPLPIPSPSPSLLAPPRREDRCSGVGVGGPAAARDGREEAGGGDGDGGGVGVRERRRPVLREAAGGGERRGADRPVRRVAVPHAVRGPDPGVRLRRLRRPEERPQVRRLHPVCRRRRKEGAGERRTQRRKCGSSEGW